MKTETASAPIAAALAQADFFKGMTSWQLDVLASCAMGSTFNAGEEIFCEGGPANRFYLILDGSVALESHEPEHPPVHIQMLGAGDVLGWSWLFSPYVWHFGARAVGPTHMIFFYGTRLRASCEEHPDLGFELVQRMAGVMMQRLQATRLQLLKASDLALRSQMIALNIVYGKHGAKGFKVPNAKKLSASQPKKIRP